MPYVNDVFDGLEDGEIDVTGVSEATLKLVLEFLNMRTERLCPTSKRPIRDKSDLAKNGVDEVFAKWIEAKSNPEAFALLNAADFLRIENLMDLAAVKLARRYLQWTMHEKRGVFGTYDLTPDEEEQLKKEHPWAEEEAELEAELRAVRVRSAISRRFACFRVCFHTCFHAHHCPPLPPLCPLPFARCSTQKQPSARQRARMEVQVARVRMHDDTRTYTHTMGATAKRNSSDGSMTQLSVLALRTAAVWSRSV